MPLYEYECFVCTKRFERIQKVSSQPVSECPSCGGAVRRLLGSPALQFKGSGWYVTDYGKGNGPAKGQDKGEGKESSSSKDKDTSSSSTSSTSSSKSESSSSAKSSTDSKSSSSKSSS